MKGRLGKTGLVMLALALVLGLTGAGFAHWSQTLYVDGTVETGTFCVGFTHQEDLDPPAADGTPGATYPNDPPYDGTLDEGYDKNVAACHSELVDPKGEHEGETVYERMLITVLNAYPSYTNIIRFSLDNCGTIPAEVLGAAVVSIGGVPLDDPIPLPKCEEVPVDLTGDPYPDVNLHFDGPADQQIDPCDELWYSLTMHFKDGLDPDTGESTGLPQGCSIALGTALTFTIEIYTVQWNMA